MKEDLDDKDRKENRRKKIEKSIYKKEYSEEQRSIKKNKQNIKNKILEIREEELWTEWENNE